MTKTVATDIVIVGGGAAGLWILNRLRQLGFSVILLESAKLGGGQTNKAQGIIHGGMKYALQGTLTPATEAIADMPSVWQKCLRGEGAIDLTRVPILSQHQYLWANGKIASKIAGFFANVALRGKVELLATEAYPLIFQNPKFKGSVYSLDEVVIDVQALVRELARPNQDAIFKIDPLSEENLSFDERGQLASLEVKAANGDTIQIKAQKYIFTAGSGNEMLQKKLLFDAIAMQRRPLHMVLVRTPFNYPLFAHCLGFSVVPRMTITTHTTHDGNTVWYLGGQIAEEGVKREAEEQIAVARKELMDLFPWLDFSGAEFASFRVDRAEPLQADGSRPDTAYVKEVENMMIAWPTKLAFAPKLADEVVAALQQSHIQPGAYDTRALRAWPVPCLAKPVWDELL